MPFQNFKLDENSSITLCEQIENEIKRQITVKVLVPGDRLPPMRNLAKELHCGLVTVNRALTNLQKEDLLVARGSRGIFVADLTQSDLELISNEPIMELFEQACKIAKESSISKKNLFDMLEEVWEVYQ